ncbi:hypothetical protein CRX72_15285 [Pantoea sp. BRM17]|nr:hypothetical protein CRX72_15285 [Pantoea sp. BRM17]
MPLFTLLREGKMQAQWPLEQDALLTRLQQSSDPQALAADYNALFVGQECSVPPYASQWPEGAPDEVDFPEDRVLNVTPRRLLDFLEQRSGKRIAELLDF